MVTRLLSIIFCFVPLASTEPVRPILGQLDSNFVASFENHSGPSRVEGNGILATQISNQDTAVLLHYP
jgi:hypothetical protein